MPLHALLTSIRLARPSTLRHRFQIHRPPPQEPRHRSTKRPSPADLSQTFLLHSRPSATKVIYLDFNGHTTTGTSWNTAYSKTSIVTPEYSVDNVAGFSNTELGNIQDIWARVVEDYAPFDVDVTTEEPSLENLRNTGGADTRWGMRVAIGGSYSDWFGSSAGGVAYLTSFTWNSDTPCFVFENNTANGDPKSTAEAISHEVGHTLGLNHDGRNSPSEGYYTGHGTGATGWAPIMGVGYYQELVQWSKGEYTSANNKEDDLQTITTNNGFDYRADDYGNTSGTAYALTGLSTTPTTIAGVVEPQHRCRRVQLQHPRYPEGDHFARGHQSESRRAGGDLELEWSGPLHEQSNRCPECVV